jgi:prepilin-type N-terminal cleavage/methylation domain-containing protein
MRARRRGFTLIEMIVVIAIMLILATTITPVIVGNLDKARVDKSEATLENFTAAIDAFRTDVKHNPAMLTQLTRPLDADDRDSCGSTYPPGHRSAWRGPYLSREVPETGLPVGIVTAQNALLRQSVGGQTYLRIVIPLVSLDDATALNDVVDGDASSTSGTIQWTAPDAQGLVTLYYSIPVSSC